MKRRLFMASISLPLLLASVAPEHLPIRKSRFVEDGHLLRLHLDMSQLLRTSDRDAMQSLSSGWATRLVYQLFLYEPGRATPISHIKIDVRIYRDIFNNNYVVEWFRERRRRKRRRFKHRESAVMAAVAFEEEIIAVKKLLRSQEQTYFVKVIAERNPLKGPGKENALVSRRKGGHSWFDRWVGVFVKDPPRAEVYLEFRTASFYLSNE